MHLPSCPATRGGKCRGQCDLKQRLEERLEMLEKYHATLTRDAERLRRDAEALDAQCLETAGRIGNLRREIDRRA